MSFLFTLEEDRLAEQLPVIFERYEQRIQEAEPLFELEGIRLELIARNLPQHQARYAKWAVEMKQVAKWLENFKCKLEARFTRNINSGQRVVAAREAAIYLSGEKDIIEINQLIIEATLLQNQLDEIVDAFRQMGWAIGNITKLRVAELQEAII